MKKTLLLIAFAAATTAGFSQNDKKETKEQDRSAGLRKISSGRGEEQIRQQVEESLSEAREDLKDLQIRVNGMDIDINLDGLKSLENLDEIIEGSLEGLDEQIERDVERSLESLEHLDLDFDIDVDHDEDFDIDADHDEEFQNNRGVRINGMTVEEYQKEQDRKDAEQAAKDAKEAEKMKKDKVAKQESKEVKEATKEVTKKKKKE